MTATTDFLFWILAWIVKIAIPIFFSYAIVKVFSKRRNDAIIRKISNITKDAKLKAKKLHLEDLYAITEDKGNSIRLGKIIGYQPVIDNRTEYSLFLVKKSWFSEIKIYKIERTKHTELKGDISMREWNFVKQDNFYVPNRYSIAETETKNNFDIIGVDAIRKIAPLVSSGIQLDSTFKKNMRAGLLMKEGEDEQ